MRKEYFENDLELTAELAAGKLETALFIADRIEELSQTGPSVSGLAAGPTRPEKLPDNDFKDENVPVRIPDDDFVDEEEAPPEYEEAQEEKKQERKSAS